MKIFPQRSSDNAVRLAEYESKLADLRAIVRPRASHLGSITYCESAIKHLKKIMERAA